MSETNRAEADDASAIGRSRRELEAFAELFRRCAPDIERYAHRGPGGETAEDVVARTFLKAFVAGRGDWQGLPPRSELARPDLREGASVRRSPNDLTRT
ncbi:hypothetical protein [Actinoallomurus sp. NPDC052274]|uniref:hypothetical protein n=1 Tax=Actinoallomurus sp. NPDC052274 TaxID=3155420 RepID=UPI0034132FBC